MQRSKKTKQYLYKMVNKTNKYILFYFRMLLLCIFAVSAILKSECLEAKVVPHHPRIYLTPEYVETLRNFAKKQSEQWRRFTEGWRGIKKIKENFVSEGIIYGSDSIVPLALAYQVTGDKDYAKAAVVAMIGLFNKDFSPEGSFTKMSHLAESMTQVAIGYDWLYDYLDSEHKRFIINKVNKYMDIEKKAYLSYPWHGHSQRHMVAIGLWGYASYGDNSRAQEFIDHARKERFDKILEGLNQLFGKGGALPGGSFYGSAGNILDYVEAVYTATGEDLYSLSPWFKDRLKFLLLSDYPGVFYDNNRSGHSNLRYNGTYGDAGGFPYRGYLIYEDGHRGRSTLADNMRIEKTRLIHHYSNESAAKQLQYSIIQRPTNHMSNPEGYKTWQEFLWFNSHQETEQPIALAHYASGMGIVMMRSDWTDGATWIFFKCGDIFSTSHQHWDQNSFSIFKKGDLAIKSGVYDGDGVSDHNVNYYSRTISSNSVLVYDPQEVFISWRGTHYPNLVNDGGQKAYREKNEFEDVDDWKQYSELNDTGSIIHYEDTPNYTYVCGDATNAYNNPRYGTPKVLWGKIRVKNDPKVSFFTRELVLLRPDYIVIFDRVHSTNQSYIKKWLLHFLNKPSISGQEDTKAGDELSGGTVYIGADTIIARAGGGKLLVKALLPVKRQIRLVGGRNFQDYWVFGRNIKPQRDASRWQQDYGEWRIEIEPTIVRKDDKFLNILYPCDSEEKNLIDSALIMSDNKTMIGAHIKGEKNLSDWVIMFSKSKEGNIHRVNYSVNNSIALKHLLCNMKPGKNYEIRQNGTLLETKQASVQGLLYFESTLIGNDTFLIKEL